MLPLTESGVRTLCSSEYSRTFSTGCSIPTSMKWSSGQSRIGSARVRTRDHATPQRSPVLVVAAHVTEGKDELPAEAVATRGQAQLTQLEVDQRDVPAHAHAAWRVHHLMRRVQREAKQPLRRVVVLWRVVPDFGFPQPMALARSGRILVRGMDAVRSHGGCCRCANCETK